MLRVVVFLLVLVLVFGAAWALTTYLMDTPDHADRYSDCLQTKNVDQKIRGCTQIIKRGKQEKRKNRSVAYNNRGIAYHDKGQYDRAIADYTQAIKLSPNKAIAYTNRGNIYVCEADFL